MDGNVLLQLLRNTLSPSSEERTSAENQLQELKKQAGFAVHLLQHVTNGATDISIRQAGAIYFKNFVQKNWAPLRSDDDDDDEPEGVEPQLKEINGIKVWQILEQDKVVIRANILESVIHAPQATRAQLLTALGKIAMADYPERFQDLLPKLMKHLTSNDQQAMYGSLLALNELVKKYEFKSSKDRLPLMQIVAATFPVLHQLFTTCLQYESIEAALVLKSIAKIYFCCIQYSFPKELRAPENFVPWIQVFLQLVEKPAPPIPAGTDPEQRHKFPWWQAKKWAYHILNRLFSRYGNPSLSDDEYKKFAKEFLATYAPEILQAYLKQLDVARSGVYISPRVLQLNLTLVADSVEHAKTWKPLKGIVLDVVKTVVFPLLCFTDEDQELWDSDPYEYVRSKFDLYEDFKSPVPAAMDLVKQLATLRKKFALIPMLSFCNDILLNYNATPPAQRNYRHKDGALCMIGSMSSILEKDEAFSNQLEGLLVAHVFPEANSPSPFLRARACWTICNFAEIPFSNPQNVVNGLQVVANCLKDPELPVKIQAALALGILIVREEVQEQVRPMLGQIMQELLNITNESDIDDLSTVMESMIETFGEDMAPFAVTLCTQLRDTFLRLVAEAEGEDDENKAVSAMGILKTIVTFVRMMDESPQIMSQLELVLLPLMKMVLDEGLVDHLEEVLEMITTFTYVSEKVSPAMWSLFPSIYNSYKSDAADYFSEMLPCFDNYISRDPQGFVSNPDAVNLTIDVIKSVIGGVHSGEIDKANGCKLIEVFLLNLSGQIDQLVPGFIELGYSLVANAETTLLKICSLEVVINALYYNPRLTLQVLESKGWTAGFFTTWFQNQEKLTRVHDIKLCVLALCKLIQIPHNEVPPLIQAGYHQTLPFMIKLFEVLPAAYENRKELENFVYSDDEESDEEEIEDDDYEPNVPENEDEDIFNEEDANYLNALREKAKLEEEDFFGDDFELEEELEQTTPLDDINEYIAFQETLQAVQANNPATFAALTKALDQNQTQFLHQLSNLANQKRIELQQAQTQQQK